jgi:hypothetical protein
MVADRTIIVSHPRLYEQNAFEQGILTAFCATHSCDEISPVHGDPAPIPVATSHIRPTWTFTAQVSSCDYRGLTVRFDTAQNMANSRLICEQFMQEVVALTTELAWQHRHAVAITWDQLKLQETPHRPEHMMQLNTLGDTVLVTVPLLYRTPGLFAQVLPWIQGQVTRQEEVRLAVDAGQQGWQNP